MSDVTDTMWKSGPSTSWFEMYQPLLKAFYTIGLIGCSKSLLRHAVFFPDDPLFVDKESNIEQMNSFFVHGTFHRGLDIT